MIVNLALLEAAARRDLEGVLDALSKGANINAFDDAGETALHKAARNGDITIVLALLAAHPNVNQADVCGWTALTYAAGEGHADVTRLLLASDAHPDPSTSDVQETPVARAIEHGHLEVVEMLLQAGASLIHRGSYRPLIIAARQGHTEIMARLCNAGVALEAQDYRGQTALQAAAEAGHVPAVTLLIQRGASIPPGAVLVAAQRNRTEMVTLLRSHGARFPSGFLTRAAEAGNPELVALALESGAPVSERTGYRDRSPLGAAIAAGSHETVRLLLEAGADPQKRDADQLTCVELANAIGDSQMRQLVAKYVKPDSNE